MADNRYNSLELAVDNGNIDECRRLVEVEGADVHEEGENGGWTPILQACYRGLLKIVKYLESRGANINDKDIYGNSCLMFACLGDHLDIVEYLMSKGGSIKDISKRGATCFYYARNKNCIRLLYRLRKWPTTMAILVLQELALIYIIDSESLIDLHQYLGRPEDLKTDNEEDYRKDEEGNVKDEIYEDQE